MLIPFAEVENEYMFTFIYKKIKLMINICVMYTEHICNNRVQKLIHWFFCCANDSLLKTLYDLYEIINYIRTNARWASPEGLPIYSAMWGVWLLDSNGFVNQKSYHTFKSKYVHFLKAMKSDFKIKILDSFVFSICKIVIPIENSDFV